MSSTLQSIRMPLIRERCMSPPRAGRFAVDAILLADHVPDVTGGGSEAAALLVGDRGVGLDAFRDDAAVPRTFRQDFERLRLAGLQAKMIGHRPGGGERKTIAPRLAKGLVGVRILIMRGMQPVVGPREQRIVL